MSNGRWREARSLDEFMPDRGDAGRARDMQKTWQAFCLERFDMVRTALESGRSAPEIAYHLGEAVHTYFRPRGVILTGQELRRLVSELLNPAGGNLGALPQALSPSAVAPAEKPAPTVAAPSTSPSPMSPPTAPSKPDASSQSEPPKLVTFRGGEPPAAPGKAPTAWTGDEKPKPAPAVSDATFTPQPSPLVVVPPREEVSFERLLQRTIELARPRLGEGSSRLPRAEALRAIDAAIDEVLRGETKPLPSDDTRERVVVVALSELCGLGLIDRLWADRSIRAIFVNGPKSVFVEREGGLGPASEVFRDRAHLLELAGRLTDKPATGVMEFQLRDGGSGTVIFPPAAPDGPVLTLRRADPGSATLGRLVANDVLDQKMAGLLRVAVRAGLRIVAVGTIGAGKTALLAALARDLDPSTRIVTVASHRAFRWSSAAKVELVVSADAPYPTLLVAAERLRPDLFVLDLSRRTEAETTSALLGRTLQGAIVACETSAMTPGLLRSADLVVQLERARDGKFRVASIVDAAGAPIFVHEEGRFQVRTRTPAFGEKVQAAGYAKALAALLQ